MLVLLLIGNLCQALQTKIVTDNGSVAALVSTQGLTRIAVQNDRIIDVRGPSNAYTIQNDTAQGAIFVHPLDSQKDPFTLFIATEQGHNYVLHLTPYAINADTILLKPKGITNPQAQHWELSTPYTEAITELMTDMATNASPEGYAVTPVASNKKMIARVFAGQASVQLTQVYTGAHLEGLVYRIQSHTLQPLTLTENEFYQYGDRAIALENLTLSPQGSTWLYKVRSYGN